MVFSAPCLLKETSRPDDRGQTGRATSTTHERRTPSLTNGSRIRAQNEGGRSVTAPPRPSTSESSPNDGEVLDGDVDSRSAGKVARFLNSSVKLVQGVLPGNLGKHILPKVEDKSDDSVCYDRVGCFTNMDQLTVPSSFPVDPSQVNTAFWLYSRGNPNSPVVFGNSGPDSGNIRRLEQFQRRRPLKVLAHGFTESGNTTWAQDLKNALLDKVCHEGMLMT